MQEVEYEIEGSKSTSKSLLFLFLALLFFQILLFLMVHFLVHAEEEILASKTVLVFFYYAIPFFSLGSVVIGYFAFCRRKRLAFKTEKDSEMLEFYKSAVTLKFALFELASISTLIAYYLSHQRTYIVFFLIVIVVFFLNIPTHKRLLEDLDPDNPSNHRGCGQVKE